MGLFPAHIENAETAGTAEKIKMPKEYEIDFKTGQLTGRIAEGLEAIKVWIWLELQTVRYRHYIYSWDYGSELEELIGKGYTEEYIATESRRMTEDCILVNADIQGMTDFSCSLENEKLNICFTANTLYGKIKIKNSDVTTVEGQEEVNVRR